MQVILSREITVHIISPDQLDMFKAHNSRVVIDTLDNNILHSDFFANVLKINPVSMYIFGPFKISKIPYKNPIYFVNRDLDLMVFLFLVNNKKNTVNDFIKISYRQHKILTSIINGDKIEEITKALSITIKTYHAHKYNIMMLLKITKMSSVCRLKVFRYLICI